MSFTHEEPQRSYAVAYEVPLNQSIVTQIILTVDDFKNTVEEMAGKG